MRSDWRDRARCTQTDPELWFPERGMSPRRAKRICAECEVRLECLAWALAHPGMDGVWGGLTERERRPSLLAEAAGPPPPPVAARQAARNRARLDAALRDAARARRNAA